MHPILFEIGGYTFYSYSVAMSLALLVSILLAASAARREGYNYELFLEGIIISAATGLVGARFLYVVQHLDYYSANIGRIFTFSFTGLSGHGAMFMSLVAALLWCRWRKVNFLEMGDVMSPYYMVGYIIVRTGGCFMGGCCYGKVSDVPWAVVMQNAGPFPRHPVQLYAALLGIVGFIILKKFYRVRPFRGASILMLLIYYGILRFTTEFFRDEPVFWLGLSLAQVASIALIIIFGSIMALVLYRRKHGKVTGNCNLAL
jgi:phosphatidylglycerol---prolipoprotein diacylglyceryl transferase